MRQSVTVSDGMQVMVWKTNFDRHLDDYVLTHVARGETQLQHSTQAASFAPESDPAPAAAPVGTQPAQGTAMETAEAGGVTAHVSNDPVRLSTCSTTPGHTHARHEQVLLHFDLALNRVLVMEFRLAKLISLVSDLPCQTLTNMHCSQFPWRLLLITQAQF